MILAGRQSWPSRSERACAIPGQSSWPVPPSSCYPPMDDASAELSAKEEAAFVNALADGTVADTEFTDELFSRCRDAINGARAGAATALDVAVLVRQVMRRGSERDGIPLRLLLGLEAGVPAEPNIWRSAGVTAVQAADGRPLLRADPYQPTWLGGKAVVDAAAAAGTATGRRAVGGEALPADPFFLEATGYTTYKTPGQRAAVRAAVSMPDEGTLITELPTGTGKTEIAVSLAQFSQREGRTVLIVVPTVALAYDFERRFRSLYERRLGSKAQGLAFAWTGDTDDDSRDVIKRALGRRGDPAAGHLTRVARRGIARHSEADGRRRTGRGPGGRRGAPGHAVGARFPPRVPGTRRSPAGHPGRCSKRAAAAAEDRAA